MLNIPVIIEKLPLISMRMANPDASTKISEDYFYLFSTAGGIVVLIFLIRLAYITYKSKKNKTFAKSVSHGKSIF